MSLHTEKPLILSDFQSYLETNETLYAAAFSSGKKLTITMSGTLKVYHNNEVVWQGIQPYTAIEKYNSLS